MSHQNTNSNDQKGVFLPFIPPLSPHLPRQYKHPLQIPRHRYQIQLAKTDEATFSGLLKNWHERWGKFLSERTITDCSYKPNRWTYTHRKLRAAYRSLVTKLPFLFTYQRYSERKIPNTTNCLDGMVSQLKNRLNVHRGARQKFRYKLITEILGK